MLLSLLLAASAACSEPERHQLDFWIGDWDLVIRAQGAEARGVSQIRSVLNGCAIEENFHGDGPGDPWAGRSFSTWVPALKVWRQTWVDDSGAYLAFKGGLDGKNVVLNGETNMRMVFKDITPSSIEWSWEKDKKPVMTISYKRRAATNDLGFWVGTWLVREDGKKAGTNRIEKVGPAFAEHWSDVDGWQGESLFFEGRQIWVTPKGAKQKQLVSHGADGTLRFQGDADRTTLTPLSDGGVRQLIETSTDGTKWTTTFDGRYERMK